MKRIFVTLALTIAFGFGAFAQQGIPHILIRASYGASKWYNVTDPAAELYQDFKKSCDVRFVKMLEDADYVIQLDHRTIGSNWYLNRIPFVELQLTDKTGHLLFTENLSYNTKKQLAKATKELCQVMNQH